MKKHMILVLFVVVSMVGCKQRQEQKEPYQGPTGRMYSPADIKHLRDAASGSPESPGGWITLGNALMDSGRFGEAIDAYQNALKRDPNNVNVRVDRGTCYRRVGKPGAAAEEFRKGIEINPNHPNAHRNLGVVLAFDLGKREEAIQEFETYLRLMPNAPDAGQIRQVIRGLKATK